MLLEQKSCCKGYGYFMLLISFHERYVLFVKIFVLLVKGFSRHIINPRENTSFLG